MAGMEAEGCVRVSMALAAGTKLGPYEIQSFLAPVEWVKCIALATRGWGGM